MAHRFPTQRPGPGAGASRRPLGARSPSCAELFSPLRQLQSCPPGRHCPDSIQFRPTCRLPRAQRRNQPHRFSSFGPSHRIDGGTHRVASPHGMEAEMAPEWKTLKCASPRLKQPAQRQSECGGSFRRLFSPHTRGKHQSRLIHLTYFAFCSGDTERLRRWQIRFATLPQSALAGNPERVSGKASTSGSGPRIHPAPWRT